MTTYALVFPGDVIREYQDYGDETPPTPKASSGAVWKPLVIAAPVDTSTAGNPHFTTETIVTHQPTTVTHTETTRDLLATEFDLTGPEFYTLVKGLPSAQKTLLRNAVNAGLAVVPDDADSDAVYRDKKRQNKAAKYLSNDETDKHHPDVITALGVLGITLTGAQLTNFNARWQEVGRIA